MRMRLLAMLAILVSLPSVVATDAASSADTRKSDSQAGSIATLMGADRVYVMAGDHVLRAGLGLITSSSEELAPLVLDPDPALISHVSGNGVNVMLGAAGVGSDSFMSDGVYVVEGNKLRSVASPGQGLLAPVVSSQGTYAAINAAGGVSTRKPSDHRWRRHDAMRDTHLTNIAYAGERLLTVADAGRRSARLLQLTSRGGVRRLGSAYCALVTVASPDGRSVATTPPLKARDPRCRGSRIIELGTSRTTRLPAGWKALAWAKGSDALLVSRGHEVAVWTRTTGITQRTDVGVRTWMAAAVYTVA